jgi:anti-anti-sigma regulatory factor
MDYIVDKKDDYVFIKITGKLNKNAIYSVREFLDPILNQSRPKIVIDLSDLYDDKDVVYQIGLINAFKKEIDLKGGSFKVNSLSPGMEKYFIENRFDYLFDIGNINNKDHQILN